jgi:structural maintenance of chromosome 3 (chondroitin sulfate proteoglycan 6)
LTAFQVVVKDQETGLRLVKTLNHERAGRVTFMPLDTLHVPRIEYPKEFGQDAVPLYKHIKFDPKFEPAVRQVGAAGGGQEEEGRRRAGGGGQEEGRRRRAGGGQGSRRRRAGGGQEEGRRRRRAGGGQEEEEGRRKEGSTRTRGLGWQGQGV